MPIIVTEAEISALMAEQKILSTAWREESPVITKRDDCQRSVQVSGEAGREFVVIARQDQADRNNFSLVLASVVDAETRRLVRLRRYDGGSRRHRNRIEHERVTGCHIHQATERYQLYANAREDGFAVATDRYSDLGEAWRCLIDDANMSAVAELPDRPL